MYFPFGGVESNAQVRRQNAGDVSDESAAGDVREGSDRLSVVAHLRQNTPHVDVRRIQQLLT